MTYDGVLAPDASWKVTVGGEEYEIHEVRPCDMPPLLEFVDGKEEPGGAFDMTNILKAAMRKPDGVCRLLAALLDPDPLGPGSAEWRERFTARAMGLPVRELTPAIGKWIRVNASFLAETAAPVVMGAVDFMTALQGIVEKDLELKRSSAIGSA
ncbi:MAG: hypothetical protein LBR80_06940 [Deltaproteobacteria bacterium]|jgi:hypothetical protein|nr:hypothetical protein [Deltaproteobacteria bacterium]